MSSDSKRKLHITYEMLQDFASMKRTWFDFWNNLPGEGEIEFIVEDFYKMSLDDLYGVLQRCDIQGRGVLEFCMNWYKPLIEHLYTNLCLDDLFGSNPSAIGGYRMISMPETDEDIMMWVLRKMFNVYTDLTLKNMTTPLSDFIDIKGMITQIEWHMEDDDLPIEDRRYIDDVKHDFLMQYDNDLILKDAPEEIRDLFITYCDELCDNGDMDALRIKGYGCYGGNSVYACDFKTSAACMERLWREGGFGYAANTLGYIYYYGRLSDGIPDYEKAFFYYSIGNTYGIIESGYKLADMFMHGYYVKQNLDMAASIIEKFYGESRYRFEQGEFDGSFADIALRMGKLHLMKDVEPIQDNRFYAYRLFLQAEFALTMRMLETKQYGDNAVMEKIRKALNDTYDSCEHRKASFHTPFPYPIYELIGAHAYCLYNLDVKELKKGTRLKITRPSCLDHQDYDMTLITYPEFSRCDLTDTVSVIAEDVIYKTPHAGTIVFDTIKAEGNGAIKTHRFYFRGECVFSIQSSSFLINLPK
ncbi:MAG: hypothetical protein MJ108_04170 [Saccharofermentans sp.]|nr:hypothetical protein [Saccharofermentans sp.]